MQSNICYPLYGFDRLTRESHDLNMDFNSIYNDLKQLCVYHAFMQETHKLMYLAGKDFLTLKAPSIIYSRQKIQVLPLFQK